MIKKCVMFEYFYYFCLVWPSLCAVPNQVSADAHWSDVSYLRAATANQTLQTAARLPHHRLPRHLLPHTSQHHSEWRDIICHFRLWCDIRHERMWCGTWWHKLVSLCINLLSCTRCLWLKPVVFTGGLWHQTVTLATSNGPPSVWWTDGCSCTRWSSSSVGVQVCFFILVHITMVTEEMRQDLRVQKFLMWWMMEELTGFESESMCVCCFLSGGSGISSGGEALSRSGWGLGRPLHITGQSAAGLWALLDP